MPAGIKYSIGPGPCVNWHRRKNLQQFSNVVSLTPNAVAISIDQPPELPRTPALTPISAFQHLYAFARTLVLNAQEKVARPSCHTMRIDRDPQLGENSDGSIHPPPGPRIRRGAEAKVRAIFQPVTGCSSSANLPPETASPPMRGPETVSPGRLS